MSYPAHEYDEESGYYAAAHACRFIVADHHGFTIDPADVTAVVPTGHESHALQYHAAPGAMMVKFVRASVDDAFRAFDVGDRKDMDEGEITDAFLAAYGAAHEAARRIIDGRGTDLDRLTSAFMAKTVVGIDVASAALFGDPMLTPDGRTEVVAECRRTDPTTPTPTPEGTPE